jgi:transmembrane sensor
MNKIYDHSDLNLNPGNNQEGFLRHVEIPYEKTREEVWTELDNKLTEKSSSKILIFKSYRTAISIAAAILLLAGVFSLLRFYTSTISCPDGQHLSYVLPDGSTIEMNADSRLAFHPLWWRFSRKLDFEGEGYFQVEKGKKFEVISALGRTEVLGTTFNIYSRDNEYKVTCMTGRVKVTSYKSKMAILSPNFEASVITDGIIMVQREPDAEASISWVNNMFNFIARPLGEVFKEIARQYGIKIILNAGADYMYTGYFLKDKPVEEVLTLVCKPFGLTFARISEKEYEISQN